MCSSPSVCTGAPKWLAHFVTPSLVNVPIHCVVLLNDSVMLSFQFPQARSTNDVHPFFSLSADACPDNLFCVPASDPLIIVFSSQSVNWHAGHYTLLGLLDKPTVTLIRLKGWRCNREGEWPEHLQFVIPASVCFNVGHIDTHRDTQKGIWNNV